MCGVQVKACDLFEWYLTIMDVLSLFVETCGLALAGLFGAFDQAPQTETEKRDCMRERECVDGSMR